ncbi:MAG: MarR family transcriptional regulator, partial [Verrucomicrobia bacterium]|nr:MarR family transcriptional regulator [Verrucomicrobiota bacterium]
MLKPHDIVIALKLLQATEESVPTYAELASALKMSASEAHSSVARGLEAGLLRKPLLESTRTMPIPVRAALAEFLVSGVKFVWPAVRGPVTRGIPTAGSLPTVASLLGMPQPELPLVWPYAEGTLRGESVEPLYPRAAAVVAGDAALHEWLALIDILRLKTGREAALAAAAI